MYTNFIRQLKNHFEDPHIIFDADMRLYTSFKAGGKADVLFLPRSIDQLKAALEELTFNKIAYTIIGNGTNTLVKDSGYKGVLIRIAENMNCFSIEENIITAQAGALLSSVSYAAAENALGGMEFLNGIPGSVGGGVSMNAGAYNGEMKNVLLSADVLSTDGTITTLTTQQLQLSYRSSLVKDSGNIVLSARFGPTPGDKTEIIEYMTLLNTKRRTNQPLEFPSAGSTFKRPVGNYAAKLIDDSNLKGKGFGGAKVSEKHAGFIINYNNATALDILNTIEMVREEVFKQFGIVLEEEVKIIG